MELGGWGYVNPLSYQQNLWKTKGFPNASGLSFIPNKKPLVEGAFLTN